MAKPFNKALVFQMMDAGAAAGRLPKMREVREALGGGSYTSITAAFREWHEAHPKLNRDESARLVEQVEQLELSRDILLREVNRLHKAYIWAKFGRAVPPPEELRKAIEQDYEAYAAVTHDSTECKP